LSGDLFVLRRPHIVKSVSACARKPPMQREKRKRCSRMRDGDQAGGHPQKSVLLIALMVSLILVAAFLVRESALAGVIIGFITVPLVLEIISR